MAGFIGQLDADAYADQKGDRELLPSVETFIADGVGDVVVDLVAVYPGGGSRCAGTVRGTAVTSWRSHAELGDEERTLKELTVIDAERPFIAAAELDGLRRVLRTGRRPAG